MIKFIAIKTFMGSGIVDDVDVFDSEDEVRTHFESEFVGLEDKFEDEDPVETILDKFEISDNDQFTWTIVRRDI